MKATRLVALALLATLPAGCATMSQDECLSGDWARVGYLDGADGDPPSRIEDHAQACAAYGVRPDVAAYMAARERGLVAYCTPPRGFREGRTGREYFGVCPPPLAGGFLAGYEDGLRVHAANEHRQEIRNDVRRFDHRINDIEDELDELRDRLDDEGLDPETRESLEASRRDLRRELRRTDARRDEARRRERAADNHADRLRLELSRFYGSW